MQTLAILGSTGSIGRNSIAVAGQLAGEFRVTALAAGSRWELLLEQARAVKPDAVALSDAEAAAAFEADGQADAKVFAGRDGVVRMLQELRPDVVICGISGAAALEATLAATEVAKRLALANKESLVMAGEIVTGAVREAGVTLIPVDSEHSAIFQALETGRREEVRRVIITASGGPFLNYTYRQLASVTPEQALMHPTWSMGEKITIDSATMMNKALEVVEARWLFDLAPEQIDVVVHPECVVHSLVEFRDGTMMAQLGVPDMRGPIRYALTYPERVEVEQDRLDLAGVAQLNFVSADWERFPALRLAYDVVKTGGTSGAVLNASNEVAARKFLDHEIPFTRICEVVEEVLSRHNNRAGPTLEDIFEADRWAREETLRCL